MVASTMRAVLWTALILGLLSIQAGASSSEADSSGRTTKRSIARSSKQSRADRSADSSEAYHSGKTARRSRMTKKYRLSMTGIKDTSEQWSRNVALSQIEDDVESFLSKYSKDSNTLDRIVRDFKKFPLADGGIRKLTQYGRSFAFLLETLPSDGKFQDQVYKRLVDIGEQLASLYSEKKSFVEDSVMRGWPLRRREDNTHTVHDGFNAGNIAHAVALAAYNAAQRGDDDTASELLYPVLGYIYDNVLTRDSMKRKVDDKGRLCRVPPDAPKERFERYKSLGDEKDCLDVPEQYNHGTVLTQAAIAAHRTIETVDWDETRWSFKDLSREQYIDGLWDYIRDAGLWLKNGMSERSGARGAKGTQWYTWKYRDLDDCKVYRGTEKDRPQDIWKATKELAFITDFVKWANDSPSGGSRTQVKRIFDGEDIHRLIVTFLSKIVRDADKRASERFACDIDGTIEGDRKRYTSKSCGGRGKSDRPFLAAAWLSIAWAAKDYVDRDRTLECDVNSMVKAVLPLALDGGDEFYSEAFKEVSRDWASELIMAKYWYYNYDYAIDKAC